MCGATVQSEFVKASSIFQLEGTGVVWLINDFNDGPTPKPHDDAAPKYYL